MRLVRTPELDQGEAWRGGWRCPDCDGAMTAVDGDTVPGRHYGLGASSATYDALECGQCQAAAFALVVATVTAASVSEDFEERYFRCNERWPETPAAWLVEQDDDAALPSSWVASETVTPEGLLHYHVFPAMALRPELDTDAAKPACRPDGLAQAVALLPLVWPVVLDLWHERFAEGEVGRGRDDAPDSGDIPF